VPPTTTESGILARIDGDITAPMRDFRDPDQEWRRLFSELYGTFLLVIAAAGGGMMGEAFPDTIGRSAAVVAPGLMVMGIILFTGKVSGAHLNPVVSVAFAARGDFPWRRGARLHRRPADRRGPRRAAAARGDRRLVEVRVQLRRARLFGRPGLSDGGIAHLGLLSVILGTASGAQNIGIFGALGVGGYIALAGLWGSPISGASMNPARTFGPELASGTFSDYRVYVAGPLTGALIASASPSSSVARVAANPDQRRPRGISSPRSSEPTRPDRGQPSSFRASAPAARKRRNQNRPSA
jgi:aquaporin Z